MHSENHEQHHGAIPDMTSEAPVQGAEPLETPANVEETVSPAAVAVEEAPGPAEPAPVENTDSQLTATAWADAAPAPAPKKNHTRLAVLLTVVAVVLCALGGVGYWLYPKIKMALIGPTAFYLQAERSALLSSFREAGKVPKMAEYSMSGQLDCQVIDGEISEEARKAIDKAAIKFSQSYNRDSQMQSLLFGILYDDKDVVSVLTEQKGGKMAISLPGLAEGKYLLEGSSGAQLSVEDITGMSDKELFQYLWSYYETMFDAIPSSNIQTQSGKLKHLNCTATTMHIDQQTAEQICQNLAQKLKSDEKLVPLLTHVVEYVKSISTEDSLITWPSESDIQETVNDLIAQLEQAEVSEDLDLDFIVYYNGRGKILGRELRSNSEDPEEAGSLLLASYTAGGKKIQEWEFTRQEEAFAIRHSAAKINGAYTGDLTVDIEKDGEKLQPVKVSYSLCPQTVGGVKLLTGQLKIQVRYEGTGFDIDWNTVKNNDKLDTDAKLTVFYKDMVSVGLQFTGAIEVSNKADLNIQLPEQSTLDMTEEEIINALFEKIDSTGLAEDLYPGSDLTAQDLLGILMGQLIGDVIGGEMGEYPGFDMDFDFDDGDILDWEDFDLQGSEL